MAWTSKSTAKKVTIPMCSARAVRPSVVRPRACPVRYLLRQFAEQPRRKRRADTPERNHHSRYGSPFAPLRPIWPWPVRGASAFSAVRNLRANLGTSSTLLLQRFTQNKLSMEDEKQRILAMQTQSGLDKCLPFLSSETQPFRRQPPVSRRPINHRFAITISRPSGSGATS